MEVKPTVGQPDESPPGKVHKPAVTPRRYFRESDGMTDEIDDALQAEAIRLVELIDNRGSLNEAIYKLSDIVVSAYYKRSPVRYSLEERMKDLAISQEQFKEGKTITFEELLKRRSVWWKKDK